MIKRLHYIILLLVLVPFVSSAAIKKKLFHTILAEYNLRLSPAGAMPGDTVVNKRVKRQREEEEKNKIKEIAKAKKQLKPEKITDDNTTETKKKPRQHRPDGLERPPEIIRRNGG